MNDIGNDIKRKIMFRKFAADNLGTYTGNERKTNNTAENTEANKLLLELYDNVYYADQSKIQNGYSNIASNRKLGKIIVFVKKAIRKIINVFLGWYIKPILDKQSYFNGKVVNSLDITRRLLQQQPERRIIDLENKVDFILNSLNISCDPSLIKEVDFNYFKFEDLYRGSRENIKELQGVYAPYFKNKSGRVLDIGCGRGEFLELMAENGINAYGVDVYKPFIDFCQELGFDVIYGDALTHLNTIPDNSLGGIFMSQVVEHLPGNYIIALIKTAYKKLIPGSYFIIETPNPDCLAAISEFNIDISHIRPVHYKTLEFIFKEADYSSIERFHIEKTLYPKYVRHLEGENVKNLEEFNQGIDNINNLLFGYRDYTIIAQK